MRRVDDGIRLQNNVFGALQSFGGAGNSAQVEVRSTSIYFHDMRVFRMRVTGERPKNSLKKILSSLIVRTLQTAHPCVSDMLLEDIVCRSGKVPANVTFKESLYELIYVFGSIWIFFEKKIYFFNRVENAPRYHPEIDEQSIQSQEALTQQHRARLL